MRAPAFVAIAISLSCCGFVTQIAAQQSDSAKELMGRAESEQQRRAVEDLIKKLQGRPQVPGQPAAPVAAAPLPAAAASNSGQQPAVPVIQNPAAAPPPPAVPAAAVAKATLATADPTPLPSVDLEVFFEYATAKLTPTSMSTLVALGLSLTDPRLADQTFIVGGYTDGRGTAEYNLRLSQQRADAVRQFLITQYKIDPKRLISIGHGKTHLKNSANPQGVENRRVEIINWTTQISH